MTDDMGLQQVGEIQDRFTSLSPEETYRLGEEVGRTLTGGEIILLTGPLGSGKTLMTKGILSSLGYDPDDVTSPSFTLVNDYDAAIPVHHIDLWRIEDPFAAAFSVGLDELLWDENAVIIIEWAERLGQFHFGRPVIGITIDGTGEGRRQVEISPGLPTGEPLRGKTKEPRP